MADVRDAGKAVWLDPELEGVKVDANAAVEEEKTGLTPPEVQRRLLGRLLLSQTKFVAVKYRHIV